MMHFSTPDCEKCSPDPWSVWSCVPPELCSSAPALTAHKVPRIQIEIQYQYTAAYQAAATGLNVNVNVAKIWQKLADPEQGCVIEGTRNAIEASERIRSGTCVSASLDNTAIILLLYET